MSGQRIKAQAPSDASVTPSRNGLAAKVLAGGPLTGGVATVVVDLFGGEPAAKVVAWPLSATLVLSLALGLFQLANTAYRTVLGHWRSRALRSHLTWELAIGAVAPLAYAAGAWYLHPGVLALAFMGGGLMLVAIAYRVVELEIHARIDVDPDLVQCSDALIWAQPFRFMGSELRLGELFAEHDGGIEAQVDRLSRTPPSARLSRTRRWIALVLLAMSATTLSSSGAAALTGGTPLQTTHSQQRSVMRRPAVPTDSRRAERTVVTQPANLPSTWDSMCPAHPGNRPEDRGVLTDAERATFDALYLGVPPPPTPYIGLPIASSDSPPGAAAGGCTGKVIVSASAGTWMAYVIGRGASGQIKSVAVVSRQFDPAVFVGDAAEKVLGLIAAYGDVGGMRQINAGSGQLYGVQTPYGTAILVRPTLSWKGRARHFLMLYPAAATAWTRTMDDIGVWLWPVYGGRDGRDLRVRLESSLVTHRRLATIVVDTSRRIARYAGQHAWSGRFGEEITRKKLMAYAAGVR